MTWGMEFVCYHWDRPGTTARRHELAEAYWYRLAGRRRWSERPARTRRLPCCASR
jgi:hypothetical protein